MIKELERLPGLAPLNDYNVYCPTDFHWTIPTPLLLINAVRYRVRVDRRDGF
jgi:hypothetical protein